MTTATRTLLPQAAGWTLRWLALLACCTLTVAVAQDRATMVVGVSGHPVASAWNPVVATVRDAPGATLHLDLDAGRLQQGEVPIQVRRTFPAAGGLQTLDFDLRLPPWRSLTWRIVHDDRVLASGSYAARERDDRPLQALLGVGALPADGPSHDRDARTVRVTPGDLPQRAAAWDGVERLWILGTTAAPDPATILTAVAAGVDVVLAPNLSAAYAPIERLVQQGPLYLGAGVLRRADAESAAGPRDRDLQRALLAYVAERSDAPPWDHPRRSTVAWMAVGYAALVWGVLMVGGAAGSLAAVTLAVAGLLLAPSFAPSDPTPLSEVRMITVGGADLGLARRVVSVWTQPPLEFAMDGAWAASGRAVVHVDGGVRVPLAAGDRVRLEGAPEIQDVPARAALRSRRDLEVHDERFTAATGIALPAGARLLRDRDAWWWLPPREDGADLTAVAEVGT